MTDKTIDEVSFDDAVRFFEHKKVNVICPSCNEKKWEVNAKLADTKPPQYFCLALGDSEGGVYLGANTPVITLSCNNCGFIKLHSVRPILNWLNEKKDDEIKQDELPVKEEN